MCRKPFEARAVAALCVLAGGLMAFSPSLHAAEQWEGVWAQTKKECLDEEGPNTRTTIDLSHVQSGRPFPLLDQYENPCKIERTSRKDGSATLNLTCFEFYENLAKNEDGKTSVMRIAADDWLNIKIDGKKYLRCAK